MRNQPMRKLFDKRGEWAFPMGEWFWGFQTLLTTVHLATSSLHFRTLFHSPV